MRHPLLAFGALAITLCSWADVARAKVEVPALVDHVNDRAGLLSIAARTGLENELSKYERATGHQFAFLSIPSLDGLPIEDFSMQVAEKWKLGDKKRDDGLLLIVAREDKKMRIEVGYGLEGAVPDALAARIIRHELTPAFARGDFDGGVQQAFALLMKAAEGEAVQVGSQEEKPSHGSLFRPLTWLFLFLLFLWLTRGGGGRRRGLGTGAYYAGMGGLMGGLSARRGRGMGGGFGGGGFGGGGFGGGGGGFGGGGASGGW